MSLGDNIRRIRKSRNLSILKLKELTGLSKSTISDIENEKSNPTSDTLLKLSKALDVSVNDFFDNDENTKINTLADNVNKIKDKNDKLKYVQSILDFAEPEEAVKFILSQPALMDFGGYDLKKMSDQEILDLANDMLFAMKLSLQRMKENKK